ncbi:Receptor-like serine/threonine-protein kinase SD1-8 [Citrus sinensis]|nr:Receptor-like serine/threonine-protein kinase SD1-8 [Citrus sinensis]
MKCLPAFDFFSLFSFILIIEFSFAADSIARGESITDGETLVSSFQSFELGFFSPGNSSNRYLGIWYKKSPRTVAWVANRNNAITDKSGVLTLSNNGSLLLLNQEKRSIWSSNSSRVLQNPVVQLLDSGNLVLRSNVSRSSDEYVWQSFDYPSDTLLPEMKLGLNLKTGFERYLTPWRSADDPTPGDFSFRLDNSTAVPELVTFMGSSKRARSGPWNGQTFEGIPWMKDSGYELIVEHKEDEIYYKFKLINDTVTTRLQLENTGTYHRFVWDETTSEWHKLYSWPFDHCDNYAECGANSNCRISKTPSCECLTGFISKSQEDWDSPDSRSCVRKPSDCPGGEGFLKLPKMKLPENYWSNQSMSLRECEAECTKNCSCRAYANSQVVGGGNGCLMWFGDLIDIKECSEKYVWGQDFFIRVPTSDLGYRRRVDQENQDQIEDLELPLFELATIANATDNFSINNKLGEGGFGRVYKGTLVDGQEIAVKRLSKISEQGLNELKNEVILFSKLQHRNLVKLLGCCIQGEEKLLIYEFMPNKSLDYFIFDQTKRELLDWSKRFHIICGTARGLLYLHQDSRLRIIHRDLKTSNVLLDHDMNPKISDFGLARTFGGDEIEGSTNKVIGTYGYMAPEYATDGLFSVKSDVFSFGILVLEIVSGKRNRGLYNSDNKFNVIRHAWNLWNKGMPWQLIDACYQESCNPDEVIRCIHISLLCVQHHPEDRPSMPSVILMLGSDSVLPQPKQPGFLVDRKSTGPDSSSSKPESSSTNASTFTELEGR